MANNQNNYFSLIYLRKDVTYCKVIYKYTNYKFFTHGLQRN